jgi:sugar/nucleoside kinase (ribokinase family)
MPRVLVVGDVMTDIVVRPEGPIAYGSDRRATIRMLPGGAGANQAAWLATEGVPVVFAGRVGRDDCERQAKLLAECGVEPCLAIDDELPTGMLVTLLSPGGERSFLTDRGANLRLCRVDLPDTLLDEVDLVHVSGYSLFAPGPRAAVLDLLAEVRRRGLPFTVDPASYSFLEDVGAGQFLDWTRGARICLPNADEAAVLAGTPELDEQLKRLTRTYTIVVVKRGAEGAAAAIAGRAERWSVAAPTVEVVDTSGAGDAFFGGFLAAYLRGEPIEACLRRGVAAGSYAVTTLGARPNRRPRGRRIPASQVEEG